MKKIGVILLAALVLLGCGRNGSADVAEGAQDRQEESLKAHRDTVGSRAFAVALHDKRPDRATAIIDSAARAGVLTNVRARYDKAHILYSTTYEFDSIIGICRSLLQNDTVTSDPKLHFAVLRLMSNAAYTGSHVSEMIRSATDAARLAHQLERTTDEHEMNVLAGYGMVMLGMADEGMQRINSSILVLKPMTTWSGINSFIIASKLKVNSLDRLGRYKDVPAVCDDILEKLSFMEQQPDEIGELPLSFHNDSMALRECVNIYRTQALAYKTSAWLQAGNTEQARKDLAQLEQTDYAQTVDAQRLIVSAYARLGMFDKVREAYEKIDAVRGADTINDSYIEELETKYRIAQGDGSSEHLRLNLLGRLLTVKDSLAKRQAREKTAELATLYRVQEEQLRANDAESRSRLWAVVAVGIAVIALFVVLMAMNLYRQKRITAHKNKILTQNIEEAYTYKAKYEALQKEVRGEKPTHDPSQCDGEEERGVKSEEEEMFWQIDQFMREQKPYLDPNMQRQTIVDALGVDKNRIAQVIRDYSGCPNLPVYTNRFRLEHGYQLLRSGDKSTVAAIAEASGFTSVRTFQKLFKEKYGMTPAEYRSSR